MNTDFIKGVVVPILTIVDENEKIDEAKQRAQVDYVINGGVAGILAFGSNGEFYMVEEDEMERGLKIMLDQAAGRVPVYFGIGAISTKKCCRLAQMAVKNGAAAVSVLQPMFLKPTYAELYDHFKTIAESVPETPVLLYNNPGRVGYTLSAQLVDELAHNVPNIVGMKDTSGDITPRLLSSSAAPAMWDSRSLAARTRSCTPASATARWAVYAPRPTSCRSSSPMSIISMPPGTARAVWKPSSS